MRFLAATPRRRPRSVAWWSAISSSPIATARSGTTSIHWYGVRSSRGCVRSRRPHRPPRSLLRYPRQAPLLQHTRSPRPSRPVSDETPPGRKPLPPFLLAYEPQLRAILEDLDLVDDAFVLYPVELSGH